MLTTESPVVSLKRTGGIEATDRSFVWPSEASKSTLRRLYGSRTRHHAVPITSTRRRLNSQSEPTIVGFRGGVFSRLPLLEQGNIRPSV